MIKKTLIAAFMLFSINAYSKAPLIIGSKIFSESYILGEILAQLLEEKYKWPVIRKHGLGGTQVAFNALLKEEIHAYPEYTGTGYLMLLKQKKMLPSDELYQKVKGSFLEKWDIKWSQPLGPNNTYALAVNSKNKLFQNIENTSDLKALSSRLRYGAPHEFMEREDGHRNFSKHYGLNFSEKLTSSMNAGLLYSAIANDKVDIIVVYSTDGRIKAQGLKMLKDDLSFFPPYQAAYTFKHSDPKALEVLEKASGDLAGLINNKLMTRLNYLADFKKIAPKVIAADFLNSSGLLKTKKEKSKDAGFWHKYGEMLTKLIAEHLELCFIALSLAIAFSLPLGIFMARSPFMGKIIFPIINTIQTIPGIALLGLMIPLIGIGKTPAIIALFLYSLLPLLRNTYIGLTSLDPELVEVAKGIGLTQNQILTRVELPMALPVILAGLKTAVVMAIGTATLASLVGAGGLGDPIFRGVATVNTELILIGAIPSAILAVLGDKAVEVIEKLTVSKGLQRPN